MASTSATNPCTMCHNHNATLCPQCQSTRYCSHMCRNVDSTHEILCAEFSRFDILSQPTPHHRRAILFPVDEDRPKLIWLRCEVLSDIEAPVFESFMGDVISSSSMRYNPMLRKHLSDTIYVCYRGSHLTDGSRPNKSVANITAIDHKTQHWYLGPFIAYSMVGVDDIPKVCRDVDMNDFHHIVDYFIAQNSMPRATSPINTQFQPETMIRGVKINCIGDQETFREPQFEAVEVPAKTGPNFNEHETSDISNLIGLPIRIWPCDDNSSWTDRNEARLFDNEDALSLLLCCDLVSSNWSFCPVPLRSQMGSVVVTREDQKPLSVLHAEALCNYCSNDIRQLFRNSEGLTEDKMMSRDEVLENISRAGFTSSWLQFIEGKRRGNVGVDDVSPYDV